MSEVMFAEFKDEEVQAFLREFQVRLKDVKGGRNKYVGLLSAIVYKDVINHFKQEMGSDGPWAEWSNYYTKHMQDIGRGGNNILQYTGKLRNNFKPNNVKTSNAGPMWFNDAKTGSGFPYAAAHDNGGDQLPKRDFMWLSNDAHDEISEKTLQFILDEGV